MSSHLPAGKVWALNEMEKSDAVIAIAKIRLKIFIGLTPFILLLSGTMLGINQTVAAIFRTMAASAACRSMFAVERMEQIKRLFWTRW